MCKEIMYMITYPDGTLAMNTQKYYRRDCVRYWLDGTGLTWKQMYKKGFRCKKVKVTFEIIAEFNLQMQQNSD